MLKPLTIIITIMLAISFVLIPFEYRPSEFSIIEISQNIVLLLAITLWSLLLKTQIKDSRNLSFHPIFSFFFIVLIYVVLGRELSWLRIFSGFKETSKLIEQASIIFVLVLLATMALLWIFRVNNRTKTLITFLQSNTFKVAVASLFFVVMGEVFEKSLDFLSDHVVFEEMSELTGYILILYSAIAAKRKPQN